MKTKLVSHRLPAWPVSPGFDRSGQRARTIRPLLRNILVPFDFSAESRTALQYANSLSGRFGGSIVLLHVVEPLLCTADFGYGPVCYNRPNEYLVKKSMTRLNAVRRVHGLRAATLVRSGAVAKEIVRSADDLKTDLIVMGTHGPGSVADQVVHSAHCPVLVVHGRKARTLSQHWRRD